MSRKFTEPDYEGTLNQTVSLKDVLPPTHLARFVVDILQQLDFGPLYARYGKKGGTAIAPEILFGLLVYGYATGVFSSRRIERATYESLPFRFVAGGHHPDHDTLAHFRKTFLPEIQGLFVQVLLLAEMTGQLQLGNLSLDGSKIHADASKSKAVSHKRLLEMEKQLREEVAKLFQLAQALDQSESDLLDDVNISAEIALRQERLTKLAEAKAVLEARAQERYAQEQAEYEAKMAEREAQAQAQQRKPRGREPKPPEPGPRDKDQYNFTDPESRIMKNSQNDGFDQHYNVQIAVDQQSRLIVACTLSNHANDKGEVAATLQALDPRLGLPPAIALDNGYWSESNRQALADWGITDYIATGRESHHHSWESFFAAAPEPPAPEASAKVKMAYKLHTKIGQAIYRLRKSTVEPVFGIIKDALNFRQFSLRGLSAGQGEWALVCLAYNVRRLQVLIAG